jgi:hypothetical protein
MASTEEYLPIPVPESLSATYLVPVSAPSAVTPEQAVASLAGRLPEPVHDLIRQMIDGPLVTIDTHPVAQFPRLPPDLLAAFGATPAQLARLERATEFMVVEASFRPGWPPAHEWAARAVAAAVAQAARVDVVDAFGLQVLDPAAALRSLPDDDGRIRLVEWVVVPYSADDGGHWFTTKGLRRFGLLELQARLVPPELTRPWGAVMTGTARRVLRSWLDGLTAAEPPAFVQLPAQVSVSGHDIALAYGRTPEPERAGSAVLGLELDPATDPDADSFLTLVPPAGTAGPPDRHYAAVCATLLGPAAPGAATPGLAAPGSTTTGSAGLPAAMPDAESGPHPDDVGRRRDSPHASASGAMTQAVETARTGLPAIRERFLSGRLPSGTQLVVKYGLPGGDNREFVWASVTSWTNPGRILAASASDAASDPAVRVGQPVVVDTADVVDWALLDSGGVVEGGWTQAGLDG